MRTTKQMHRSEVQTAIIRLMNKIGCHCQVGSYAKTLDCLAEAYRIAGMESP